MVQSCKENTPPFTPSYTVMPQLALQNPAGWLELSSTTQFTIVKAGVGKPDSQPW